MKHSGFHITLMFLGALALIFLTQPAEAQGTLFVEGDSVGIGTATPANLLHVEGTTGELRVTSTGTDNKDHATLFLHVAGGFGTQYRIRANNVTGSLEIKEPAGAGAAMKFRVGAANNSFVVAPGDSGFARVGIGTPNPNGASGEHTLDVDGAIFQRGSVLHADYVFEPDYELESIEEHAELMWENKHLPAVPSRTVDENGREIVEIGAQRVGMLEELEKAHIYIAQLHERNAELAERISRLESILDEQSIDR